MSTEMHVLVGDRVPARSEWQAAIDRLGLPLQLDPALEPGRLAGVSPCKLRGQDSRLGLRDAPAAELLASFPTLAKAVPRAPSPHPRVTVQLRLTAHSPSVA